jgi:hypothetical protein
MKDIGDVSHIKDISRVVSFSDICYELFLEQKKSYQLIVWFWWLCSLFFAFALAAPALPVYKKFEGAKQDRVKPKRLIFMTGPSIHLIAQYPGFQRAYEYQLEARHAFYDAKETNSSEGPSMFNPMFELLNRALGAICGYNTKEAWKVRVDIISRVLEAKMIFIMNDFCEYASEEYMLEYRNGVSKDFEQLYYSIEQFETREPEIFSLSELSDTRKDNWCINHIQVRN